MSSDFSVMPEIVLEGRRVINNITRAASLFLTKTLFSFLLEADAGRLFVSAGLLSFLRLTGTVPAVVGRGIQTAAHDAGDLADAKPEQNAGDDPGKAEVGDSGQDQQGNDKAGPAGLLVAVRIILGHSENSLI